MPIDCQTTPSTCHQQPRKVHGCSSRATRSSNVLALIPQPWNAIDSSESVYLGFALPVFHLGINILLHRDGDVRSLSVEDGGMRNFRSRIAGLWNQQNIGWAVRRLGFGIELAAPWGGGIIQIHHHRTRQKILLRKASKATDSGISQ